MFKKLRKYILTALVAAVALPLILALSLLLPKNNNVTASAATPITPTVYWGLIDEPDLSNVPEGETIATPKKLILSAADDTGATVGYKGSFKSDSTFNYNTPWSSYVDDITSVEVKATVAPASMVGWFMGMWYATSIDLSGLDTSNVTDMSFLFVECEKVAALDLSGFNTSNVTNMAEMFTTCKSLTTLDLSGFDTSNVTNMSDMFYSCIGLQSVNLSGFDVSKVDDFFNMFSGCRSLASVDLSSFDISNAGDVSHIFSHCDSLGIIKTPQAMGSKSLDLPVQLWDGEKFIETITSADEGKTLYRQYHWGVTADDKLIISSNATDISGTTDSGSFVGNVAYSPLNRTPWYDYRAAVTSVEIKGTVVPASTSYWFSELENVSTIDLSGLNTSRVTDMICMFNACHLLESLDLSGFDTSNVKNMSSIFEQCESLESLDLSGFNTSKVTDMSYMFCECSSLKSLIISGFDTSIVTNMYNMFAYCSSLTSLDVSKFDTSEVIDMDCLFENCESLTSLDLSGFVTTNVKYMNSMFDECFSLTTLDLSGFDMSGVESFDGIFDGCDALGIIKTPKKVGSESIGLPIQFWNGETLISAITSADVNKTIYGRFYWGVDNGNKLVISSEWDDVAESANNGNFTCTATHTFDSIPWKNYRESITSVEIKGTVIPASTAYWFNFRNVTTIDLSGLDTSRVENMERMFYNCNALESLDLSGFDTSNVTNMSCMFAYCQSLESLDVSVFNTSNVTNMSSIFEDCNELTEIDVSGFDTSNVTDMSCMFYECYALESLDVSGFDTSNVTTMRGMFYGCESLESLNLSGLDTSKVENMEQMFYQCYVLKSLDLSGFNTSNVTTMCELFDSCYELESLILSADFDTSKVKYMNYMFNGCESLISLDVSGFDTSNVIDINELFKSCKSLTLLDLSNFDMSNVNYISDVFTNCDSLGTIKTPKVMNDNAIELPARFWNGAAYISEITSDDVSKTIYREYHWGVVGDALIISSDPADISGATNSDTFAANAYFNNYAPWNDYADDITTVEIKGTVTPISTACWFNGMIKVVSFDLSGLNTLNVTDMRLMFNECSSLISLDLSGLNTSNVTDMYSMFATCYLLSSLNLSGFDTSKVTNMSSMFEECYALESLDLSDFDTSNVTDMRWMFNSCKALTSLDLSKFDMSNVADLSYMLDDCDALEEIQTPKAIGDGASITLPAMYLNGSTPITEITSEELNITLYRHAAHDFAGGDYTSDSSHHWKICKDCGAEDTDNKVAHNYSDTWEWHGTTSATATLECSDCHHTETVDTSDISSETTTVEKCTTDGVETYTATVTFNGEEYSNSDKTTVRTKLGHDFAGEGSTYASDGTHHWKVCSRCDAEDSTHKEKHRGGEATCTEQATCLDCGEKYGTVLGHSYDVLVVTEQPTKKNYTAFDAFDPDGMVVYAHCSREGCANDGNVSEVTEYDIIYGSGINELHYGKNGSAKVTLQATVGNKQLSCEVTGLSVAKLSVEVTWEYATNSYSTAWGDWVNQASYVSGGGTDYKLKMRASFTGGDGKTVRVLGADLKKTRNGLECANIITVGDYGLSIDETNTRFADYTFTNNSATFNVTPITINLNDVNNFYWLLADYDSVLRSGYLDGEYRYYSVAGEGRTYVKRSIVRNRGEEEVTIKLYGKNSNADNDGKGLYDIEYLEGCTYTAVGMYTAKAKLTLTNENYKFVFVGEKDGDRYVTDTNMTVKINDDGTVDVEKVWYMAQMDNGLKCQHLHYGQAWHLDDWTFGSYVTQYAPRLEHGDNGKQGDTYDFAANDNKVTFKLYRIEGDDAHIERVLIGSEFNRAAFAEYINGYMPAGSYLLEVKVEGYTEEGAHVHWWDGAEHADTAAGIYFEPFEEEYEFKVKAAELTHNLSELDGSEYVYDYDGSLKLYGEEFELEAPVLYATGTEREGVWANAKYDEYYKGAELLYSLLRWDTSEYLTLEDLTAIDPALIPVNAGEYEIYVKLVAPNYKDVSGVSFTVKIGKIGVDVPENQTAGYYDGKTHSFTVDEDALYKVVGKGNAFINANETGYNVTLRLNDADNYAWKNAEGELTEGADVTVKLIIKRAEVTVPADQTVVYNGSLQNYEVAADAKYTVVSKGSANANEDGYDVTLRLTDADNYVWKDADGNLIEGADATVKLTIKKDKVAVPGNQTVAYNGEEQNFEVAAGAKYTVVSGGYTEVNEDGYDVTLRLTDADNYVWKDADDNLIDEAEIVVKLIIVQVEAEDPDNPDHVHFWKKKLDNNDYYHYYECLSCGLRKDVEEHDYNWVLDTAPTTESTGVKHEECAVCGHKRNEDTEIAKLDATHEHTLEKHEAEQATCTEAGVKEYWHCTACGKDFADADGYLEVDLEEHVIPAKGHDWNESLSKDNGGHWYECLTCGERNGVEEHDYNWVLDAAPTTESAGVKHEECAVCGHKRSEGTEIAKLDVTSCNHTLEKHEAEQATCTEAGVKEYWHCTACGKNFADADGHLEIELANHVMLAKGHVWSESWNNGADGHWHVCLNCDERNGVEEHDYNWVLDTAPTTESTGVKHEECAVCGRKRSEGTEIAKLDATHEHKLEKHKPLAPTCDLDGNKEYWYCADCKEYFADKNGYLEVEYDELMRPAKGHIWSETWSVDAVNHWHECSRAEQSMPRDIPITG